MFLGLLLLAGAPCQDAGVGWLERFQAAEEALADRDFAEAESAFTECLSFAPENPTVAYHLACLFALDGNDEDALDWIERAVDWGYDDAAVLEWDPDLAPLRGVTRFAALARRARENVDAEAPIGPNARIVTRFRREPAWVSANGERVVTGRGEACLWDAVSGELVAFLANSKGSEVRHARFDPTSRWLVVSRRDGRVDLRDGRTGRFVRQLEGASRRWGRITFTVDGRSLVMGEWDDGTPALRWTLPDGELVASYGESKQGIAVSPDGSRVLTIEHRIATLWDAEGKRVARLPLDSASRYRVRFAHDGQAFFVATGLGPIVLARASDGTVMREIEPPEAGTGLRATSFGPDGELITLHADGRLRTWRGADEPPDEWTVDGGSQARSFATFDPTGTRLFVGRFRRFAKLFDVPGRRLLREWKSFRAASLDVESPGHVVIPFESGLEVVETESGESTRRLEWRVLDTGAAAGSLAPDTALVLASDGSLREIDLATGTTRWSFLDPEGPARTLATSRDGTSFATANREGAIRMFDARTFELVGSLAPFQSAEPHAPAIGLHPARDRIATWGTPGGPVTVRPIDPQVASFEVPAHGGIRSLVWSPNGTHLATGHRDRTARLWNADSGEPVGDPMEHPEPVESLAFDPSGERLATGSWDTSVRVWSVPACRPLKTVGLKGTFLFGARVGRLKWTEQDQLFATTGDWATVQLIDGTSLEWRWMFDFGGGNAGTQDIDPNADGTRVYTSGVGAAVLDAEDGRTLADFTYKPYYDLWGTADDRFVLAGESDRSIAVLDGQTFEKLYDRTEFADNGYLIRTPSLYVAGTREALRESILILDGTPLSLIRFAPRLYDPKRVRASAAGVSVRPVLIE